jgi:hypothetical protein
MGGRPKVHSSGNGEYELGYYRLNLDPRQLDEVAKKLAIPGDSEFRQTLSTRGMLQPADGQEVMVTYKGRYVRITYLQGAATKITPPD